MKYYLYDEKTKQFIKEQEGYLDPLETKAQGKDVYIVPPFSTTEKPNLTCLKDNEILVFDGNKWQVEQEFYVGKIVDCQDERVSKYVTDNDLTFEKCDEGFKIVEKPAPKEKTLDELKEEKHAEISAEAHKYSQYECGEMYLTSSKGFRINADHKSQDNIRGLIALGQPCAFKDFDNVFHADTSIDDLNTMLTECYANGASLYQQKFAYEARVDAAKSAEDLNFEVTFSMADFSA